MHGIKGFVVWEGGVGVGSLEGGVVCVCVCVCMMCVSTPVCCYGGVTVSNYILC